jgi:hypothetical protein
MTGSALAPVIVPIVAIVTLTAWLTLVFHADAHPFWQAGRGTATKPGPAGADAAPGPSRPEISEHQGEDAGSEPVPVATRRAA